MNAADRSALKQAIKDCSDRGLYSATKWAAELFASTRPTNTRTQPASHFMTSTPARTAQPRPSMSFEMDTTPEEDISEEEEDAFRIARCYFDSRELERTTFTLKSCRSPKARFVRSYAQFLSTERKALDEWNALDSTRQQPPTPVNHDLSDILRDLQEPLDPFLLFLKGTLLYRLKRRAEAIECLIRSVTAYSWNWSAWIQLSQCLEDAEECAGIQPLLPDHPATQMFLIRIMIEMHSPSEEELEMVDKLLERFPTSLYLLSQKAHILYLQRDFQAAEQIYDDIIKTDPYRIDDIHIFSDILYVTGNRTKLSKLAHNFLALDKDRPEVCCFVGNHYSLRAEHDKAIRYFRRAVQLDRTCLSAWTLMGHEYIEMKNSQAAIEAYRRAVDVNRRDYRAWFGLGQAYELLSMHQYALHYYQRATALRPYDVRIWNAMAKCYADLGRAQEAIDCYKRALIGADPQEITINGKIAALYEAIGDGSQAAAYHQHIVEVARADEKRSVLEYAKSCFYVASHEFRLLEAFVAQSPGERQVRRPNVVLALEYLEIVVNSHTEEGAAAQDMIRKVKERIALLGGF
ncbi:cell division control protein 23 [Sistotremastrum niveocremeum HHB9708]|uniref:Cell division control protein 23 n=2 Tax=Sistotremastraceae TaxID=3402574 RepID=A0A165A0D5_9AGAM|nr:cell division control protein 23 [Sistotremastrum niveocremeum HHB9708]KZT41466.1 TPR-like protein [Sistotremastrum suecicum HHB10207 ss-3]